MHRHLFAPLAASAALAVFVAACGGSATAAPSAAGPSAAVSVAPSVAPSAATAPSPSPEVSAAPAESTAPVASDALPSFAIPSFNADKDLEAVLPSTFDGATLQKFSFKGAEFLDQDPTSDFNKAVTALGLNATNVSVAVAADAAGKLDIQFVAIRFAGRRQRQAAGGIQDCLAVVG